MFTKREVRDLFRTLTLEEFAVYAAIRPYLNSHGKLDGDADLVKGLVFPTAAGITAETLKDVLARLTGKSPLKSFKGEDGCWYLHDVNFSNTQNLRKLGADKLPSWNKKKVLSGTSPGVVPHKSGEVRPEVEVEGEVDPKTFVGADAPPSLESATSLPPGFNAETEGAQSKAPKGEGAGEVPPVVPAEVVAVGSKSEDSKTEPVVVRPTVSSLEVEAGAVYSHYKATLKAGGKADAEKSIASLLKGGKKTPSIPADVLMRCIDRAAQAWANRDQQYFSQANNFFGKKAVYADFLGDDWTAPAGGNGSGLAGTGKDKDKTSKQEDEDISNLVIGGAK